MEQIEKKMSIDNCYLLWFYLTAQKNISTFWTVMFVLILGFLKIMPAIDMQFLGKTFLLRKFRNYVFFFYKNLTVQLVHLLILKFNLITVFLSLFSYLARKSEIIRSTELLPDAISSNDFESYAYVEIINSLLESYIFRLLYTVMKFPVILAQFSGKKLTSSRIIPIPNHYSSTNL